MNIRHHDEHVVAHSPEQSMCLSSDEMYAIFVCPVIDFDLLSKRNVCKNNGLLTVSYVIIHNINWFRTWNPLIKSTVIS